MNEEGCLVAEAALTDDRRGFQREINLKRDNQQRLRRASPILIHLLTLKAWLETRWVMAQQVRVHWDF